jgi:nicotinamidase/pyrazinamidase
VKPALIIVDIQNDFLPGGNLAVPRGNEVVEVANRMMLAFDLVVATQDWHPSDHESFAQQHHGRSPGDVIDLHGLEQVLWPVHCVQGSRGADFAARLNKRKIDRVFPKGTDRTVDSYSGFFDNGRRAATGLGDYLRQQGVTDVFVMGLATDYCVKFTALDALEEGFATHLIEDGCRGVDLGAGDSQRAIAEMETAGVRVTRSSKVTRGMV